MIVHLFSIWGRIEYSLDSDIRYHGSKNKPKKLLKRREKLSYKKTTASKNITYNPFYKQELYRSSTTRCATCDSLIDDVSAKSLRTVSLYITVLLLRALQRMFISMYDITRKLFISDSVTHDGNLKLKAKLFVGTVIVNSEVCLSKYLIWAFWLPRTATLWAYKSNYWFRYFFHNIVRFSHFLFCFGCMVNAFWRNLKGQWLCAVIFCFIHHQQQQGLSHIWFVPNPSKLFFCAFHRFLISQCFVFLVAL